MTEEDRENQVLIEQIVEVLREKNITSENILKNRKRVTKFINKMVAHSGSGTDVRELLTSVVTELSK